MVVVLQVNHHVANVVFPMQVGPMHFQGNQRNLTFLMHYQVHQSSLQRQLYYG